MTQRSTSVPNTLERGPAGLYGAQYIYDAAAGDGLEAQCLLECADPSESLWFVSGSGSNVTFTLRWGTFAGREIRGVLSPFRATLSGIVQVVARRIDADSAAHAEASLTVAAGGADDVVRSLVAALGPCPPTTSLVVALLGATVTVNGTPIVLAPTDVLRVAGPVALTSGGPVLLEHTL